MDRGLGDKFGDVDTKAFCKPYLKIESNVKTDMLRCAFGNDCRTGSELEWRLKVEYHIWGQCRIPGEREGGSLAYNSGRVDAEKYRDLKDIETKNLLDLLIVWTLGDKMEDSEEKDQGHL